MTINLAETVFVNDFYFQDLPKGGTLAMNIIDETITSPNRDPEALSRVNLQIIVEADEATLYTQCSSVIGLKDSMTEITTDHKEYEGQLLNKDNMKYCKVVVYDL